LPFSVGQKILTESEVLVRCRQIQGVLVVMRTLAVLLGENLGGRTSETGVGKFEIGGVAFFFTSPQLCKCLLLRSVLRSFLFGFSALWTLCVDQQSLCGNNMQWYLLSKQWCVHLRRAMWFFIATCWRKSTTKLLLQLIGSSSAGMKADRNNDRSEDKVRVRIFLAL